MFPVPYKCVGVLQGHRGPYCVSGGDDKLIRLWNPFKQRMLKQYEGHGYEVFDIKIVNDNSAFASCGGDKVVYLWNVQTGEIIRRFRDHYARVNCIAFNEDCSVLASGSFDKTVKLWDLRSRNYKPIQTLDDFTDSVTSISILYEEILTSCVDGKIRIYDIRVGKLFVDKVGPPVTKVSFSKDGKLICASLLDSKIKLLDKMSGDELNEYKGHLNKQYKIDHCFSNDDKYILSGSEDGKIYAWDVLQAKLVHILEGHSKSVLSLAYHKNDICVISGGADSTIRIWKQ